MTGTALHRIRVGTGGWTFAPWRGVFYPEALPQQRELEFASRAVSSIEINGTFYSSFKPETWRKWRDATPDDFVFAVKAARYCTHQKSLANAGRAVNVFLSQGLAELGPKLGPINWQLPDSKPFDAAEMEAFLQLLPARSNGVEWRHAVEARHASFAQPAFFELARQHGVAIVYAKSPEYPELDERTAAFSYARFMVTEPRPRQGVGAAALGKLAARCQQWAKSGEVFAYFIAAAKVRNPAAAQALAALVASAPSPAARARPPRSSVTPPPVAITVPARKRSATARKVSAAARAAARPRQRRQR